MGRSDGQRARDAGLRRIADITKVSLSGALAGTVVFAGLAYEHRAATAPHTAGTSQATRAQQPTPATTLSPNGDDDGGSSTFTPPPAVGLAPSGGAGGFAPIVSGAS